MKPLRSIALPAGLLALAQVWHAVTPVKDVIDPVTHKVVNEGGYVGLVGGLFLLLGSIVASLAARQEKEWARPLGLVVGLGVSLGFIGYHATSLHTPFTNPYFGRDGIGPVQLAPVFGCIAIGAWLVYTAWPARSRATSGGPATA